MILNDMLFSIMVALVLAVIFAGFMHRNGPRTGFAWLFLMLFLATWTGGVWGRGAGSQTGVLAWLPFLLAGIFFAFILAVISPKRPKIGRDTTLDRQQTRELLEQVEEERELRKLAYVSLNIFFWLALVGFMSAILLRYLTG